MSLNPSNERLKNSELADSALGNSEKTTREQTAPARSMGDAEIGRSQPDAQVSRPSTRGTSSSILRIPNNRFVWRDKPSWSATSAHRKKLPSSKGANLSGEPEASREPSQREPWLDEAFRQYGCSTMAFATLQPGLSYFETNGGYLAYETCMGVTFVLGDPIGPPECYPEMIDKFLKSHAHAVFCQLSRPTAEILSERGWFLNEIGADMELHLPDYDFEGPKKAKLRQAAHKIEREGYRINELSNFEVDHDALEELSTNWIARKSVHHEARFLVRPFDFGPEPGVRKFYLLNAENQLVAFVAFDPLYLAGQLLGYSPSIKRHSDIAPVGAEEAITKVAIEKFREEGMKFLRLGLLPLYDVQKSDFRDAYPLRKILQWVYAHGNRWIYNFQGMADFKHRYRGELTKSYLASNHRWGNALRLIALMRTCRFF